MPHFPEETGETTRFRSITAWQADYPM